MKNAEPWNRNSLASLMLAGYSRCTINCLQDRSSVNYRKGFSFKSATAKADSGTENPRNQ